ncbi:MAG TPA: hypothetical protein VGL97_06630 [Bryobacteraceae bacterium]|jgi:hypothetical protein
MKATLFALVFASSLAFGQVDHDAVMNRGDHIMGFSHEKTTHHFELNQDGGVIEVRANDVKDTASRDQIRGHFQHVVQMFAAGNFNVPMLVHAQDVPGTAVMSQLKYQLHWSQQDTPRGAKITVVADNKPALDAVYEFLRFQIADHETGDCTAVR